MAAGTTTHLVAVTLHDMRGPANAASAAGTQHPNQLVQLAFGIRTGRLLKRALERNRDLHKPVA